MKLFISCIASFIACGLAALIASVAYSYRQTRETPVWYSVPLCPTRDVASCDGCTRYVGVNLDSNSIQACPVDLSVKEAGRLVFPVPSDFFMAEQEYRLSVYRHSLSTIESLDASLLTNPLDSADPATVFRVLYSRDDETEDWPVDARDAKSFDTPPLENDADDDTRGDDDARFGGATQRHLLKGGGGYGGGRSYRRRNYYTPYRPSSRRRSHFGYSATGALQASVADPVIVKILTFESPAAERGGLLGFFRGMGAGGPSLCADPYTGCDFEISSSLSRDEFVNSDFVFSPSKFGSMSRLAVDYLVVDVTSSTLTAPRAFFSLSTEGQTFAYELGEFWLPLFGFLCVVSAISWFLLCPWVSHVDGDLKDLNVTSCMKSTVTSIDVSSNDIVSLRHLGNFSNLESLTVNNNDLRNLEGIDAARKLTYLSASSNDIVDIDNLDFPAGLLTLNLGNNDLVTLVAARNHPSLSHFDASNNDLNSLTGIENFPSLRHLDVRSNDLSDIRGLRYLHRLEHLDLSNNDLTDLNQALALGGIGTLTYVNLSSNDFSSEDIARLKEEFSVRLPTCRLVL